VALRSVLLREKTEAALRNGPAHGEQKVAPESDLALAGDPVNLGATEGTGIETGTALIMPNSISETSTLGPVKKILRKSLAAMAK